MLKLSPVLSLTLTGKILEPTLFHIPAVHAELSWSLHCFVSVFAVHTLNFCIYGQTQNNEKQNSWKVHKYTQFVIQCSEGWCDYLLKMPWQDDPRALKQGEVLWPFQGDVLSKFWISLYILYIFTSPSAQDKEVSQLRETFSPKSPSRMTPDPWLLTTDYVLTEKYEKCQQFLVEKKNVLCRVMNCSKQ